MITKDIILHASEHLFLLSSSEILMLRNFSRFKNFKYCSQIGGSESIRDIQEAKNADSDAFEFKIVESIFSISKIMQALKKTYSDGLEELSAKYIILNISNNHSLDLLTELKDYQFPDFMKRCNLIINFDRRALIKSIYKFKDNSFEVSEFENDINKIIYNNIKEINNDQFLISVSGGITYESLMILSNMKINLDYLKTGLFSIKTDLNQIMKMKNILFRYQSLEAKLISIMNKSISNKTNYLEKRQIHLTNYLVDLLN